MHRATFRNIALVALLVCATDAVAQLDARRIENIKKAAFEIGKLQQQHGSNGAFKSIQACYGRELASAKNLSPALEACMTQDILVSQTSAAMFARNTPEARKKYGFPEPDDVMKAMAKRIINIYARFQVNPEVARSFQDAVKTHGAAAYAATFESNSPSNRKQ